MTGGALIQLIAYGAQDVYLTGNPQITFFKIVYRRYTNFAMEWVQQKQISSNGKFGQRMEIVVERVGDLLGACHLEVSVPALKQVQSGLNALGQTTNSTWVGFTNSFMTAVLKSIQFEIGGQLIDKQYGDWMEIWSEIAINESLQRGYREMVGKWIGSTEALQNNAVPYECKKNYKFRLPLLLWFCRNPGCYLPLIALQYHEVRFILDLRSPNELIRSDVNIQTPLAWDGTLWNANDVQLWSNYVYLDTDERRKFAQLNHEMLIEQLQYNTAIGIPDRVEYFNMELEFNHPLKECMWVIPSEITCGNSLTGNDYFNYSGAYIDDPANPLSLPPFIDTFSKAKIVLNGNDRFDAKDAEYFRLAQPYEHHTRCPQKQIYIYSFGLRPEEIQPSGTCNASRIDSFVLNVTFGEDCCLAVGRQIRFYATNYNILRIMSGMGGLAFSN
jgi:hypothetical protein